MAFHSTSQSARKITFQGPNSTQFGLSPSGKRSKFFCDHCKIFGHSKERCFKIHGYPNGSKSQDKGKRVVATVQDSGLQTSSKESGTSLTPDLYNQLVHLLQQQSHLPSSSQSQEGQLVNKCCSSGIALSSFFHSNNCNWIIDSGATNHICPDLNLFTSYQFVSYPYHIRLPDGNTTDVQHIGSIQLSEHILLVDVLHVPSFHFCLLSVHKLLAQTNNSLTFTADSCLLQEPLMRQPLELGKQEAGLYYMHQFCSTSNASTSNIFHSVNSVSISSLDLWHCRMGHFPINKIKLIPTIETKGHFSICKLRPQAKMPHNSFPTSYIKSTTTFDLKHVDT